uniref:SsrA-binding protein n=1 Tax=Chaetoceros debilis TaxID=122233 RepID=A0A7S3PWE1_9STRA|mmetsp:Transcript_13363/g.19475  ORF Transcript_13363/g.19475 Transcript_13363/m.19475 type:complete len:222 (-) Transcript_13363:138-803(-)
MLSSARCTLLISVCLTVTLSASLAAAFITPTSSPAFSLASLHTTDRTIASTSTSTSLFARSKKKPKAKSSTISVNRQARRNYEVVSSYDAGISLLGSEIKAIRDGKMNLGDGFVRPDSKGRGMSLCNVHIGKHSTGSEFFNHEERRVRPLLLTKEECRKLRREIDIKGMTIVPLKAYFKGSHVKIKVGLCKGKNQRDKRNDIKDREQKRDDNRMMKSFRMG